MFQIPLMNFVESELEDYRVIYVIEDEIITITVVKVAHRKEIYE